jgi:hypothetical protein
LSVGAASWEAVVKKTIQNIIDANSLICVM